MTSMEEKNYTKCIVTDLMPGYILKKIVLVIRPTHTVQRVIDDLKCLLTYSEFDIILQPADETMDMIRLNDNITKLIYDVPGFSQKEENALFLLQLGQWSGDIKKRFDLHSLENPLLKPGFARNLFKFTSNPEEATIIPTGSNTDASGGDGDNNRYHIRNNLNVKCKPFKRSISAEMSDENQQNEEQIEAGPSNNNVGCSNGSGDGIGNHVALPSALKEITKDEIVSNVGEEFGIRVINGKNNRSRLAPPPIKIRIKEKTEDEEHDVKNVVEGDISLSTIAACLEEQAWLHQNECNSNGDGQAVCSSRVKQREDSPPPEMSAVFINESLANTYRCRARNSIFMPESTSDSQQISSHDDKNSDGYVGLVNHAMTCYLNSFLQSLYMTPEFRNTLYRWDCSLSDTDKKSLPYQIKKLFYRLQTSERKAIDTLGVIRSITWIATETCQQHDVQELCRIVFDDLEQKFRNTSANNLIKNLYEGKMIDYVKCLECGTEKTREDSFLDIQLPIRPFGSNVSFKDIMESLNAFITPEILDGNNQYHCEKCNKKCNAHKGLKITRMPYILMLQLKRFNFDFATLMRTKINDTVQFPEYLNLAAILNATEYKAESYGDSNGMETNGGDGNKYTYELFTIMVHAGTSAGGHYYAYIKDLETKRWYKFDDQRVRYVYSKHEMDIAFGRLTEGGKSGIGAYMLIYRRIDPEVNEIPIKVSEFPENMKEIVDIVEKEERIKAGTNDVIIPDSSTSTKSVARGTASLLAFPNENSERRKQEFKPRVHFYNPVYKKMKSTRVYLPEESTLREILKAAHQILDVEKFAPLNRCRLVGYNSASLSILGSFENEQDVSDLRKVYGDMLHFLLEIRTTDMEFETYSNLGMTWQVYTVDLPSLAIEGPFLVYTEVLNDLRLLAQCICKNLCIKEKKIAIKTLKQGPKAFVSFNPSLPLNSSRRYMKWLLHREFRYLIQIYVNVPKMTSENVKSAVELQRVKDAKMVDLGNGEVTFKKCNPKLSCDAIYQYMMECGYSLNVDDNSDDMYDIDDIDDKDDTMDIDGCEAKRSRKNQARFFYGTPLLSVDPQSVFGEHGKRGHVNNQIDPNSIRAYKVIVNSFMTIKDFKWYLECITGLPENNYLLHRKGTHRPVLHERTVSCINDGETLCVQLGRQLRENEYSAKIFFFRVWDICDTRCHLECIFEWIYSDKTTVAMAKEQLVKKFQRLDVNYYKTLNVANVRIWLKGGRNLIKKYCSDSEILHVDVQAIVPVEFIVQECGCGINPQPSIDSLIVFVRYWCPQDKKLGQFEEIIMNCKFLLMKSLTYNSKSLQNDPLADDELCERIASISDLRVGDFVCAKVCGYFPNTELDYMTIDTSLTWISYPIKRKTIPLSNANDGNVYFYKRITDSKLRTNAVKS